MTRNSTFDQTLTLRNSTFQNSTFYQLFLKPTSKPNQLGHGETTWRVKRSFPRNLPKWPFRSLHHSPLKTMFVLEHKVEESKKLNVVNPEVNFQTWHLSLQMKPSLNLITTIHVERKLQGKPCQLSTQGKIPISPTISRTKFWIEDLEIRTYYQDKPQIMHHKRSFWTQYPLKSKMSLDWSLYSHNTQTITDSTTISFSLPHFSQVWTTPIKFTYIKHPFWSNPTYLTHI